MESKVIKIKSYLDEAAYAKKVQIITRLRELDQQRKAITQAMEELVNEPKYKTEVIYTDFKTKTVRDRKTL